MAHNPINPGEHIAPNMHGFDPISKAKASALISAFNGLTKKINTTNSSFYFDTETLTTLLQGERNTTSDFQGFRVMFGLDAHNRIVLLINRVRITEDAKGIRRFEYVPQLDTLSSSQGKGIHEVLLYEYALVTVNLNGHTQLHRIDINEAEYRQLRLNFQAKFENDNPMITYRTTARSILKPLGFALDQPALLQRRHFVTGFYIGWGTLELIREEISKKKIGLKLWLGYGTLTLNPASAKCLHLIAIAADEPGDTVEGYTKPTVWSTQDQTRASRKLDKRISGPSDASSSQPDTLVAVAALSNESTSPVEFPPLPFPPGDTTVPIGTLGSSCSDPANDTM